MSLSRFVKGISPVFRLVFLLIFLGLQVASPLSGNLGNAQAAPAMVTVPAEINKSFTPIAIVSGATSKLRITVYNLNANVLSSAFWEDNMPAGITIADPLTVVNTCGGTVRAIDNSPLAIGGGDFELTGGTVPPQVGGFPGSCYVEIDVTSTTPGNLINTIPAGVLSSETIDPDSPSSPPVPISNTTPASATLNVIGVEAPSLSKAFAPNTIFVGDTSTLTITIHNNDAKNPLTETIFTDVLPTNGNGDVKLATPVNASLSGCGGGTLTDSAGGSLDPDDTSVKLNNGTIAKNGNCVISVDVTSTVQGAYTNTIPAGSGTPGSSIETREGVTNADPAEADLNVQAFTLTKAFVTSPIPIGGTSDLTITIQNHAPFVYNGAALDDTLPTGLAFVTGTGLTTCTPGGISTAVSFIDNPNTNDTVRLTGGTLPASASCTITATVEALMSASEGTKTNTIGIGDLTTAEGAENHAPASGSLDVQSLSIAKSFTYPDFAAGQTTTLEITISNPSPNNFTNASLSDILPTSPNSNLFYNATTAPDPVTPSTTCVSGAVAIATTNYADDTITLTGATIPSGSIASPGTCTITATVTTLPGAPAINNYQNTIPTGSITTDEGGTNASPASAIVDVQTVSVNKFFQTNPVIYPNASRLRIYIYNPVNGAPLTGIGLTDTLPVGLEIAPYPPSVTPSTTCDDTSTPTLTAVAGTRDIILANGSMPAGPGGSSGSTNCYIQVYVRPTVDASSGTYINNIPPGSVTTAEGPTNSNNRNRTLTVEAVSVSKIFQYANFEAGGTNELTITLTNPTNALTDPDYPGVDYTNVSVSDTLPTSPNNNLEFVPGSAATTCISGGAETVSLTGTPPRMVTLTGGTIPANDTCTITATVTTDIAAPSASYVNTILVDALTTDEGPKNKTAATAPVEVYAETTGITASKTFTPSSINIGENSQLHLTFAAPADIALTSFQFTDTLPAGVTVSNSTAPSATNCGTLGGAWPPANGAASISATGGTIAAGATCTIDVYVTSITGAGSGIDYDNTITPANVSTAEDRTISGNITDTLTVSTPSTLIIEKAFYPTVVSPDGLSTLTITLENEGMANLVNVSLDDILPGSTTNGVVVASIPNASTTCGSGVISFPTTQTIRMTGGSIPAQVGGVNGLCTISVNVQGKSTNGNNPTTHTNTIPATNVVAQIESSPSTMNAQGPASDDLTVEDLDLEIVKGFDPQLVYGGADSEMSIILRNPNTGAELTGITFTDNMWLVDPDIASYPVYPGAVVRADYPATAYPKGEMILVDPPHFDASNCGPDAKLTKIDNSTFTFSDGYLAAGDECTLTLDVTMTVNGNRTNTIPALAVSSFNGAQNQTPTSATLTNLAGASISKSFAPNPVASGLDSYSILTISIRTTSTVNISGMGLVDSLPTGLQVAGGSAPAPTNSCGGTLTATPGAGIIQLSNGALPTGFSDCFLTIPVTGATPGEYTNTIIQGALEDDQGVTNIQPAEDTLTLTPYSLGNLVWFDTDNDGLMDGSEVGVEDVRVELYRDDGTTSGVFDAGDTYLGFDTTNSTGHYRFDDLSSGNYVVVIPGDNFRNIGGGDTVAGDPLKGYLSSGTSIAGNGTLSDSIGPNPDVLATDSDDNGVTTFTANTVGFVSAQNVILGPGGSEPTGEIDPTTNPESGEAVDDQSNRTVDFGFYRQQLGNLVFQDVVADGTYTGADAVIAGATVQLFASDGTTEINVGPDGILSTDDDASGGMTTDASGNYLFSGLPAGSYVVKVLPPGYKSTIDTFNAADTTNPNTNADDNDNGVGEAEGLVSSNVVTLTPGSVGASANNTVTNSTGTTYDPTVDFGFTPLVSIGSIIWNDVDNNGIQNSGEGGIAGVIVTLLDGTGVPVSGVPTQTTASDGLYYFGGLPEGDYRVQIQMPGDYTPTINQSTSDNDNSENDSNIASSAGSTHTSRTFTLTNDGEPNGVNSNISGSDDADNTDDNNGNMTVDFGFYPVVSIGSIVWNDLNHDGAQTAAEPGIAGAVVTLLDGSGTPVSGVSSQTTGVDGLYHFDGLNEGDYRVRVAMPGDYAPTINQSTSDNDNSENDSNIASSAGSTHTSRTFTLTNDGEPNGVNSNISGSDDADNTDDNNGNMTVDFGFYPVVSIGSIVWNDLNHDGAQTAAEPGIAGAVVTLLDGSGTTVSGVSSQTTGADGLYYFDNLIEGDYQVRVTMPSGYTPTINQNTTNNDNSENDSNIASSAGNIHTSGTFTLTNNGEPNGVDSNIANSDNADNTDDNNGNMTVDFGFSPVVSIGSLIWSDLNQDGLQTSGEPGIAGVTVTLYDVGTGNPVSGVSPQTTGADGLYYFGDLFEDDYYVQIDMPVGYTPTINQNTANNDDSENDSNIQSSPSVNTYRSGDFTLTNNGEPDAVNSNIVNSDDADNADDNNGNMTVDFGFNPYDLMITKDDGYNVVGPNTVLSYTIDIYNDGASALTNLTATDTLPSDVTYQSATPVPTSVVGNVVTWNHAALGIGGDLASGAHAYITLIAVVNPSPSGSSITNDITVTDSVTSTTASDDDTDTITATSSKALINTNHTPTTFPEVTIGEILTYRINIVIPAGVTIDNLRAVDVLDAGLVFDECQAITSTDLTTSRGNFVNACLLGGDASLADPAVTNSGHDITFNFGDVTNTAGADRTLTLEYWVDVLDIAANVDGVSGINNAVIWQWDGGSLASEALPVEIVEPDMDIDKSTASTTATLGSTIPFSLDIAHTTASSAHAYDVVVTDELPSGVDYVPSSESQPVGALLYDSFTYDSVTATITVIWDYFPLGESSTINFDTIFVGPAPATNEASVAWTSLEIDPGPGYTQSEYNPDSTERWYDPTDLTGVDDYNVSSSIQIDIPRLPSTGFAPNHITSLPKQPAAKKYQNVGFTWIEIPDLRAELPVVGVPLKDDGWDLTWLDAKAGYLAGTAYPGLPGNTVITAHVYLADGSPGPFLDLHTLMWGDEVILHANGQRYTYQIRTQRKVWPDDLSVLKHEDYDWITLITCQGYDEKLDSYDYRIAVRAVLIDVQPE